MPSGMSGKAIRSLWGKPETSTEQAAENMFRTEELQQGASQNKARTPLTDCLSTRLEETARNHDNILRKDDPFQVQ
jgi:hypothetical protein